MGVKFSLEGYSVLAPFYLRMARCLAIHRYERSLSRHQAGRATGTNRENWHDLEQTD